MTDISFTLALLQATPGWDRLCSLRPELDLDTVAAILEEAAKFAEGQIAPLNPRADRTGCQLEDGRVLTPEGYRSVYRRMGQDGWLAVDLPEELGGQGLPLTVHAAVAPFFEGACMAFMMINGSSRAAAHMLAEVAPEVAKIWAPKLAAGEWAATICISEPDAGSDVGRIRTRATKHGDEWRVTGTKVWISFGDHDMTSRIGHCLLARTGPAESGTRGLSLFLVPNQQKDGSENGVSVSRIEEKMGLHGSPTCVMEFDGARATLLGEEGRGLQQMFAMIELMRLQTACQGLGVASTAARLAHRYAAERRQGGRPDAPAVPITEHADVRRQLLAMDAPTAVLRALVLELATALDLARISDDPQERTENSVLAAFLLPLAKNFGGETAFAVASGAVQVLGGAGYTREWPVEQLLRDTRVITIYEGTTGIQAQDFLMRRLLREKGTGLAVLRRRITTDLARCPDPDARMLAEEVVKRFVALSEALMAQEEGLAAPDLAADGYLRAGWLAISAWLACRMINIEHAERPAKFLLHALPARMSEAEALCRLPAWI